MDRLRDEYGNPVRQTDEYGNLVHQTDEYPIQNQYSASTIGAYDIRANKYAGGMGAGVPANDPSYGAPGIGTGTGTGYQGGSYDTRSGAGTGAHYEMGMGAATRTGTGETGMGTHGGNYDTGVVDMGGGQLQHQKHDESGLTGMLHRSGIALRRMTGKGGEGRRRD